MTRHLSQPGILAPTPVCGRSLAFRLAPESEARQALARLRNGFSPDWGVVGLGEPLVKSLRAEIPRLRGFPALSGPGFAVPSTRQALWVVGGSLTLGRSTLCPTPTFSTRWRYCGRLTAFIVGLPCVPTMKPNTRTKGPRGRSWLSDENAGIVPDR